MCSDMAPKIAYSTLLTAINTTYNNTTTTASSAAVDLPKTEHFIFQYALVSANTPTRIKFAVQFRFGSDGQWHDLDQGFFPRFEHERTEVATIKRFAVIGPVAGDQMRVVVTATGTTASNTFTVSEARLAFKR